MRPIDGGEVTSWVNRVAFGPGGAGTHFRSSRKADPASIRDHRAVSFSAGNGALWFAKAAQIIEIHKSGKWMACNRPMANSFRIGLARGRLAYQRAYLLWVYRLRIVWLATLCVRIRSSLKGFGHKQNPRISEIRELKAEDLLATWLGLPEFLRNDTQIALWH